MDTGLAEMELDSGGSVMVMGTGAESKLMGRQPCWPERCLVALALSLLP